MVPAASETVLESDEASVPALVPGLEWDQESVHLELADRKAKSDRNFVILSLDWQNFS